MSKRGDYVIQLKPLIQKNAFRELEDMLISNSDLPGPRGNLELAYAFGDCVNAVQYVDDTLWNILTDWALVPAAETPPDGPGEFIPFCAVQALGAVFTLTDDQQKTRIIEIFKSASNDPKWRIREAVAMGLQWIEEKDFSESKEIFVNWIDEASLLERRAIIAALAHPPVLYNRDNVRFCLEITGKILNDIIDLEAGFRKTEEFRVLRKGLEYAISVFTAHLPDEGFEFMKKWALSHDPDIKKIIKSNLGKSRLTKKFGPRVSELLAIIN